MTFGVFIQITRLNRAKSKNDICFAHGKKVSCFCESCEVCLIERKNCVFWEGDMSTKVQGKSKLTYNFKGRENYQKNRKNGDKGQELGLKF